MRAQTPTWAVDGPLITAILSESHPPHNLALTAPLDYSPRQLLRSFGHEQSAKPLAKRALALPEAQIEHVEVGSTPEASGNDILEELSSTADVKPLKKKEKQTLKHELFLKRLESSRSPYSKSHERRVKRKAREQVAGGLTEMHAAIADLEATEGFANQPTVGDSSAPNEDTAEVPKAKSGQIGEGKGATLTKAQRKRALQAERMRLPLIRANPQFAANPFATIRTHAQNTLVKHQVPDQTSSV
ncbi:hypothetical protein EIP91_005562 [Steccherinum ochraceum]|uniref:Ribosome biogenesis protein SLX9 n=1 Tax=Steccherinum ochraceum TaxID=92696 RepID=A0A4R0RRT6_9APHY|nr:hypothetical protein EIP91_005562 [Steccherinum ochraceum]